MAARKRLPHHTEVVPVGKDDLVGSILDLLEGHFREGRRPVEIWLGRESRKLVGRRQSFKLSDGRPVVIMSGHSLHTNPEGRRASHWDFVWMTVIEDGSRRGFGDYLAPGLDAAGIAMYRQLRSTLGPDEAREVVLALGD